MLFSIKPWKEKEHGGSHAGNFYESCLKGVAHVCTISLARHRSHGQTEKGNGFWWTATQFLPHCTFMGTKYLFYSSFHIIEDTYSVSREIAIQVFMIFGWCSFFSIGLNIPLIILQHMKQQIKLFAPPCPPNIKYWSRVGLATAQTSVQTKKRVGFYWSQWPIAMVNILSVRLEEAPFP